MKCFSDQTLHWVVRRLLEIGGGRLAVLQGREPLPDDCPESLKEAMEHLKGCPSCALTAQDLLDTEVELPMEEEVERILSLVPVPSWSPSGPTECAEETDPTEYAVAADSCGAGERISLDGHGAISLASKDGRYLVRIFRNDKGEGATAVLLQTSEEDCEREGESHPLISLSIGGKDYTFDTDGTAQLPAFPATPPSLVLRMV